MAEGKPAAIICSIASAALDTASSTSGTSEGAKEESTNSTICANITNCTNSKLSTGNATADAAEDAAGNATDDAAAQSYSNTVMGHPPPDAEESQRLLASYRAASLEGVAGPDTWVNVLIRADLSGAFEAAGFSISPE